MHLLMSSDNHRQSDSDNSSSFSEPESRTRIGDDYQVKTTQVSNYFSNQSHETLIWAPTEKLSDTEIEDYVFFCRSKYSYNIDQALAMLFWHKHNIRAAVTDMKNYAIIPDEWSDEDKVLFEQAFLFHGKNFNKIRTMLPDKKQSSLVNYYYMWKKTRNHKSLMDHKMDQNKMESDEKENENEEGDADSETNATSLCCNCDEITPDLQSTPKGMLCNLCYNYWKRTGVMRPEHANNYSVSNKTINNKHYNGVSSNSNNDTTQVNQNTNKEKKVYLKTFRKPPKGIYLNYDELISLTQFDQNEIFESLDNTVLSLKRQVQSNKQEISMLTSKFIDTDQLITQKSENLLIKKSSVTLTTTWTQKEAELAIQGFCKYGNNFAAIADVIETKNEATVSMFYDYHRQYSNLDDIVSKNDDIINPANLKLEANKLLKATKDEKEKYNFGAIHNESMDDIIIL